MHLGDITFQVIILCLRLNLHPAPDLLRQLCLSLHQLRNPLLKGFDVVLRPCSLHSHAQILLQCQKVPLQILEFFLESLQCVGFEARTA
jgi:hypothetical protein